MNSALPLSGFGRFRVNIFRQRGEASILIRYIDSIIPYFEDMSSACSRRHYYGKTGIGAGSRCYRLG